MPASRFGRASITGRAGTNPGGHWLLRSAGCYERGGLKVDGCIVELSVERRVHFGGFGLGDLRAMGVLKLTEQERRIAARCSAGLESARISCLPGDRPSVGQPSTPCGERPLWRLSSANYRPQAAGCSTDEADTRTRLNGQLARATHPNLPGPWACRGLDLRQRCSTAV